MRTVPIREGNVHDPTQSPATDVTAANAERSRLSGLRLLIVDDHTLHRDNLAAVLATDGAAPASAWDLQSLFAVLTDNPPELVLLNLETRDSGMLLHVTLEICPQMRIIVFGLSEDDEAGIVACAEAGVAGYHLRTESLDELLSLVRRVADGGLSCSPHTSAILLRTVSALATKGQPATQQLVLTRREGQILRTLEMGRTNAEIADELSISVHTVKNHVHSLLKKLGVRTRAEAAAFSRSANTRDVNREN